MSDCCFHCSVITSLVYASLEITNCLALPYSSAEVLRTAYCVMASDVATTETEALELFVNKFVLQADFAPPLQCGRIRVTYT